MSDHAGRITPEVAAERARAASARARHAVHRARMLAEHGKPEADTARAEAMGHVYEARFYRARAAGETLPKSAQHALAARG